MVYVDCARGRLCLIQRLQTRARASGQAAETFDPADWACMLSSWTVCAACVLAQTVWTVRNGWATGFGELICALLTSSAGIGRCLP